MKPFVLSIRAEYARRILVGDKRVEIRKSMPGGADRSKFDRGDTALIYESRGRGRIVASFTVGSLIHAQSPADLWRTIGTMDPGSHGIDRAAFFKYFEGRETGVAFGVTDVRPLDMPLPADMHPPQHWARWKGPWPLEGIASGADGSGST